MVIEGNMSYCGRCKMHGHEFANCRKKKTIVIREEKKEMETHTHEAGHKRKPEWKVVEGKKVGRGVPKLGYGPDLLFAYTNLEIKGQEKENRDRDQRSSSPKRGRNSDSDPAENAHQIRCLSETRIIYAEEPQGDTITKGNDGEETSVDGRETERFITIYDMAYEEEG